MFCLKVVKVGVRSDGLGYLASPDKGYEFACTFGGFIRASRFYRSAAGTVTYPEQINSYPC